MPTLSVNAFQEMPISIQQQLVKVFDCAQQYTESKYPNCFPNDRRTRLFAQRMNRKIGYPNLTSKFEYYHLVLSRNTVLRKHIDTCNDSRAGYNLCVVYSFFQIVRDVEYRISIIMTTRNNVGVAFDRAVASKYITQYF